MDIRFGTRNLRNLFRAGSLERLASELAKCSLDLVEIQVVRWFNVDSQPADNYIFLYGDKNDNNRIAGFFIHMGIILAVKRVEFISGRISYVTLRGRWCHIFSECVYTK
jgi:hypothetical protein